MSKRFAIFSVIFIVSVGAAAWSIAYLSTIAQSADTPIARTFPAPTGSDSAEYVADAKNILAHGVFSQSAEPPFFPDTNRTPGYPVFIAAIYGLFGSLYAVLFAQVTILFFTCVLLFEIAEKIIGWKWGLALVALYVFDPNTLYGASVIMTENLFVFLFTAALYLLFFTEGKPTYVKAAAASLALAAAAYVRPVAIYMPLLLVPSFLVFWRRQVGARRLAASSLIFLGLFALFVAPWYMRNHRVSGVYDFSAISAYNLFSNDAPTFLGTITGRPQTDIHRELEERAGIPVGSELRTLNHAPAMKRVGFQVILEHPSQYVAYRAGSTLSFFVSSGWHQYGQFTKDMVGDVWRESEPALSQAIATRSWKLFVTVIENHGLLLLENLAWAIIAFACFAGAIRSKDVKSSRLFLLFVIYFAVVSPLTSNARYRVPVTPFLLLGALSALAFHWDKRKEYVGSLGRLMKKGGV